MLWEPDARRGDPGMGAHLLDLLRQSCAPGAASVPVRVLPDFPGHGWAAVVVADDPGAVLGRARTRIRGCDGSLILCGRQYGIQVAGLDEAFRRYGWRGGPGFLPSSVDRLDRFAAAAAAMLGAEAPVLSWAQDRGWARPSDDPVRRMAAWVRMNRRMGGIMAETLENAISCALGKRPERMPGAARRRLWEGVAREGYRLRCLYDFYDRRKPLPCLPAVAASQNGNKQATKRLRLRIM